MKVLGWVIILISVAVFVYAGYEANCLHSANPDATERRLWLDHPSQMREIFACLVLAFIGLVSGTMMAFNDEDL